MYLEHFGLREPPFSISPDTGFYFDHPGHRLALNTLLVALRSGEGFLKVTGEVGTGKTLLCRTLLNTLGEEGMVTAYIPNPNLTAAGLRSALADELGLEHSRNLGQHRIMKMINERLIELHAQGKRVVLIVDEAQALPNESLETLRLFTNLETEKHKLLQVVLFGQPELDTRLAKPSLRQLRQRITFSQLLTPMDRPTAAAYVDYRLRVAGYAGSVALFGRRALGRLHRASRGYPRLINIIAHKALMVTYGKGRRTVSPRDVALAAADTFTGLHREGRGLHHQRLVWLAGLLLAVAVLAAGYQYWSGLR